MAEFISNFAEATLPIGRQPVRPSRGAKSLIAGLSKRVAILLSKR